MVYILAFLCLWLPISYFSSYKPYSFIKIIHTWIYILLYWDYKIFQVYIQYMTKCSQLPIGYLLLSLYHTLVRLFSFPWDPELFLLLNLCKHKKCWTYPFISFACESDDHSKIFFSDPTGHFLCLSSFSSKDSAFLCLLLLYPLTENPFSVWFWDAQISEIRVFFLSQ